MTLVMTWGGGEETCVPDSFTDTHPASTKAIKVINPKMQICLWDANRVIVMKTSVGVYDRPATSVWCPFRKLSSGSGAGSVE
jgi:hypothetical protein